EGVVLLVVAGPPDRRIRLRRRGDRVDRDRGPLQHLPDLASVVVEEPLEQVLAVMVETPEQSDDDPQEDQRSPQTEEVEQRKARRDDLEKLDHGNPRA